jgi:polyphenol oxidase
MLFLGPARVIFTGRAEGDLGHGGEYVTEVRPEIEARRRAVLDRPWSWIRQVHGDTVVVVNGAGDAAGAVGDASVTSSPDAAIAVLTADCAPIALAGPEGVVAVVHAGWRGLLAGVVESAVAAMRATDVVAALGACIHPECYEFGAGELEQFDASVRATTSAGKPALDLPGAVRLALDRADVELVYDADTCTACAADRYFSFRARTEMQRQAVVAWLP